MRTWLGRHRRWSSPVYLAGESYGTTRGAALADKLQDIGVALSGLILVSCAMDLQSIIFSPRNDLPYALFLPAFACVAQFHGKLKGPIAESPAAARKAARGVRRRGISRGAARRRAPAGGDAPARDRKRVAELTGLPASLVEEKNLRISDHTFFFELLRDRGLIVGRLEARVTGPMAASRTRDWEFDPGIEAIAAPYTMAAHAYMSEQLGVDTEARYEVLSMEAHKHGTGTAARTRATASPARAPTCRARCGATRTCACSSPAATTTSARPTARATGRSPSSTCRPTCWRACSTTTTTPAT